jgi:hypothetical protein
MASRQVLVALALVVIAEAAWPVQQPIGANAVGGPQDRALSSLQAKDNAARQLALIDDVLGRRLLVACNKCRSGFALKVVEQALQKEPTLPPDQYAEVERLRTQGEALYKEEKYQESLELLLKAEAILGIDASGSPLARPQNQASGASQAPVSNR